VAGALLPVAVAAASFGAAPAWAQVPAPAAAAAAAAAADISKPIIVRVLKPKSPLAEFKGTVMHATRAEITVRGRDNEMAVRSFPLSPQLADAMQKLMDRGGYQFGDKVTVRYNATTGVAFKISGKPSKPI
jgi:hypothetical protein